MRGKIQERANKSAPGILSDEVRNKKRNAPNFGQRRSPRFTALGRWKITGSPGSGTGHVPPSSLPHSQAKFFFID
ncbi:hypothetical protein TNCV_5105591 [Trichonephila clavipes]|nr:hypothetical protein TNCV_5105591 [Trichonephila clavipes]